MTNAYKTIASEGAKSYGLIVREILSNPPPGNGLIFHCTAGKDRTGVLASLLLQLAGVSDEVNVEDYGLTNIGLGTWLDFLVDIVQKQTGASAESARRMASARPESMAGFLTWLRSQGGAKVYFKEKCGLTEDEVEQLRKILIVEEPPLEATKN
jgi:protein tyrosine/serine phosphatase